jgi:hypothetical protein
MNDFDPKVGEKYRTVNGDTIEIVSRRITENGSGLVKASNDLYYGNFQDGHMVWGPDCPCRADIVEKIE